MSTETSTQVARLVKSELNSMKAVQVIEDNRVADRFVRLYNEMHDSKSGELIYEREKFHFLRLIQENPELEKCTGFSLYGAFLDTACDGLTFEGGSQPMVYLTPKSFKVSEKGQPDRYEKRVVRALSPYGELFVRIRNGHLRHADPAVVVYDCDFYQKGTDRSGTWIDHRPVSANERPKDAKIIGCFIRIVRTDGSVYFFDIDQDEVNRLKTYSEKQNAKWIEQDGRKVKVPGKANDLYSSGNNGSIDVGFLKAKTLKHSFKTMPKLAAGQLAPNATETEELPKYPAMPDPEPEDPADEPQDFIDAEEVAAETVTVVSDENDEEGGF